MGRGNVTDDGQGARGLQSPYTAIIRRSQLGPPILKQAFPPITDRSFTLAASRLFPRMGPCQLLQANLRTPSICRLCGDCTLAHASSSVKSGSPPRAATPPAQNRCCFISSGLACSGQALLDLLTLTHAHSHEVRSLIISFLPVSIGRPQQILSALPSAPHHIPLHR